MILNRIREVRLQNKIEKELKNRSVCSNNKVESALILLDEKNDVAISKQILSELELDAKKVKEVVFYYKSNNEVNNSQIKISKKQFSWIGGVKDETLKGILNFQFDLIINLTKNNLYLDYLTVVTNSQFKVGLSNSDTRFYDFMISTDLGSKKVFSKELKKYLKILNKI